MALEAAMNIGETLLALRIRSGLEKQRDMARRLGWDPGKVSRIESGAVEPSSSDIGEYVTALDPELASDFNQYLEEEWKHLYKPHYLHANRRCLARADQALGVLSDFEKSEKFSA